MVAAQVRAAPRPRLGGFGASTCIRALGSAVGAPLPQHPEARPAASSVVLDAPHDRIAPVTEAERVAAEA
jgi:hypothetical protein